MIKHKYRNHPVADLFPPMSEQEYQELKASIQEQGQLQPIIVDGEELLDGRHRLRACDELGREADVVQFSTLGLRTTPAAWILAINAQRRNLSPDQKLAILSAFDVWALHAHAQPAGGQTTTSGTDNGNPHAAASGAEFPGRNQPGKSPTKRRRGRPAGSGSGRHREGLAKAADETQYRARQMSKLRKQMPELADEVVAGRLSLKQAMRQLNKRDKEQRSKPNPSTSAEPGHERSGEAAPMPFAYVVSIVTLLISADMIIEAKDTSPGQQERRQKIAALANDFQSLAGYHVPFA